MKGLLLAAVCRPPCGGLSPFKSLICTHPPVSRLPPPRWPRGRGCTFLVFLPRSSPGSGSDTSPLPFQVLRREFNFCVIDEVDSILIDEARTPLIISGPADKPSDRYLTAAKVADAFQKGVHYKVDEKQRSVVLTEEGYEAAEELLQVKDLYDPRTQWALYIINALKAKELQKKDVNYIVKSGEVIIVDEFTGRTMVGRRWSDGLHQAVEAKEGVAIQNETITIASVTYQSFFRCAPVAPGWGNALGRRGVCLARGSTQSMTAATLRCCTQQSRPLLAPPACCSSTPHLFSHIFPARSPSLLSPLCLSQ